jgi:hypothetical protein
MLKTLGKGLFGRVLGYAGLALGFWLLFQAFSRPSPALGVLGGVIILVALYLMVLSRQSDLSSRTAGSDDTEEDEPVDSFNGSDSSSKLPS